MQKDRSKNYTALLNEMKQNNFKSGSDKDKATLLKIEAALKLVRENYNEALV